jgi:hypothetical protein
MVVDFAAIAVVVKAAVPQVAQVAQVARLLLVGNNGILLS